MQKLSLIFITILVLLSQKVTIAKSFSTFEKIEKNNFYLAWELPIESKDGHSAMHGNYHFSDEPNFKFDNLVTNKLNKVVILQFDGKKNIESYSVGSISSRIGVYEKYPLYWLGLQNVDSSYEFTKKLIKSVKKEKNLYALLNTHGKNKETLEFYKEKFSNVSRISAKEDLVFWIGQLNYSPALNFLKSVYANEHSQDLKEKIIFAFSLNESKERTSFLLQIAKSDKQRSLRKKAIFWLSNMASKHIELFFNEVVYSDDDIELKESAIFALYQRKAQDDLKEIAMNSKDVRLRKKAMFWLGQLGGNEHLEFLENILSKN